MRILAVLLATALSAVTALGACSSPGPSSGTPDNPAATATGPGPYDDEIKVVISRFYLDDGGETLEDVAIDVHQGRVMLTGSVPDEEARTLAVRLARSADNVTQVIDEIQVAAAGGFAATARDLIVEIKLKAKLLVANGVAWANYRWRAVNGTVYLLGEAHNWNELDRVVAIARDTADVRSVVTHVRVSG